MARSVKSTIPQKVNLCHSIKNWQLGAANTPSSCRSGTIFCETVAKASLCRGARAIQYQRIASQSYCGYSQAGLAHDKSMELSHYPEVFRCLWYGIVPSLVHPRLELYDFRLTRRSHRSSTCKGHGSTWLLLNQSGLGWRCVCSNN